MATNDEFLVQLGRTADRLRTMTASQLDRDGRVAAARSFMVTMAEMTHPGVVVPELATTALGDQLFVIGRDFADVASESDLVSTSIQLVEFRKSL